MMRKVDIIYKVAMTPVFVVVSLLILTSNICWVIWVCLALMFYRGMEVE